MMVLRIGLGCIVGALGFLFMNFGLLLFLLLLMMDKGAGAPVVYIVVGLFFLGLFVLSWPDYREIPAFFSRDHAKKVCAVGLELSLTGQFLVSGFQRLLMFLRHGNPGNIVPILLGVILLAVALIVNSMWLYSLFKSGSR